MALLYSQIRVELREVKLSDMPQALLTVSPKATVPVLQLGDGEILEESLDIMYWALSVRDPQSWIIENLEVSALVRQNDEEFKPLLDAYKYADRYPDKSQDEYRADAEFFPGLLNRRLEQSQYLLADRITLADVAIMPFIRQFAGVDPKWFERSEYKSLHRWLSAMLESALFRSAMHKYAFWQPGDATVYFGVDLSRVD